jgi:hypothetical protein
MCNGNIVKRSEIEALYPAMVKYAVWDIKKECFQAYGKNCCKLFPGLWDSEEEAEKNAFSSEIEVVEIDFRKNIPPDIKRIIELGSSFSKTEKRTMLEQKLRQLVKVFIFWNDKLKDQLKNKYKMLERRK